MPRLRGGQSAQRRAPKRRRTPRGRGPGRLERRETRRRGSAADAPDETRKRQRRAAPAAAADDDDLRVVETKRPRVSARVSVRGAAVASHSSDDDSDYAAHGGASRGRRRRRATRGTSSAVRFREVDSDSSDEAADAIVCARCGEGDDASKMILCDACDSGTHIYCLRPKLSQVPRGRWFCPTCEAQTEAARVARAAIENAARRMVGDRKIDAILASRRRAGAPPGPGGADASVEFLCKFENLSHRKREWLPLWAVRETAEGKLRGHWKRTRASLQNPEVREDFSEEYLRPERVVAVESGEMLVKWHGLGYDEATWEPEEDASEAAVAAATESAKRRDEEERAAREDAGSPGKTAEARAAAAAARSSADAPPPGAPSSRGWGNRTTRATRWTRRRCTPRARESRRVTETPISRRSWRRSWRRFSRAPRGIRRLRNPRPSREDAARRALWRLKISNICSSARGPDTAWTPPRTGEKPRRRRSPRENRRGARGGDSSTALRTPPAPRICTRAGSPCTSISARACCGCSISSGAVEAPSSATRWVSGRRSRRLFSWTRRARWVSSAGPRWWWRRCRRCPTGRASSKRGVPV